MRKSPNQLLCLALCCVAMVCTGAMASPLRLPNIFGSHMVLQRELPVIIWGWAEAGEAVEVSLGQQKKSTRSNSDGMWRVQLDPLQASRKGLTLNANTKHQAVEFSDVPVGEVWLCPAHSNMA